MNSLISKKIRLNATNIKFWNHAKYNIA